MIGASLEDGINEGRIALDELEKYLRDKNMGEFPVASNGKHFEDRKLLDNVPRNERLKHIKGSPLGLTLEELDDRGLIDGGGSLPSHSSSNRGRRSLEMRQRTSRMRDREIGYPKSLHSFFHMIRLLTKRGLNVEEYCRHRDPEGRGIMDKRQFASMLRKLCLPFGNRELNEIKYRYVIHNTDQVDYEAMLRDAGVLDNTDIGADMEGESMDGQGTNIGVYSSIIADVKRMIANAMDSLGKTPEDVYYMFSQWDHEGTGTVTATQFLRVLSRMHVTLNDNDQDFLVELLDLDHMGRVYYDGIMNFVFGEGFPRDGSTSSVSYSVLSPQRALGSSANDSLQKYPSYGVGVSATNGIIIGDDTTNNETLSNISQASGVLADLTLHVGNLPADVPESNRYAESSFPQNAYSAGGNRRPHTASRVPAEVVAHDHLSPLRSSAKHDRQALSSNYPPIANNNAKGQRPLTASGRVNSSYQPVRNLGAVGNRAANNGKSNNRPESAKQYVVDVSDDVINDDSYLANGSGFMDKVDYDYQQNYYASNQNNRLYVPQNDGRMYADESNRLPYTQPPRNVSFQNQTNDNQQSAIVYQQLAPIANNTMLHSASAPIFAQPAPDINQVAKQYLQSLRQAIINRTRGNQISDRFVQEIFKQYFDRDGVLYFQRNNLLLAFRDLINAEISTKVADVAISLLAMDQLEYVSYNEFAVFVMDPNISQLECKLQQQCSSQFLVLGREYQSYLYNGLWMDNSESQSRNGENGIISVRSFVECLNKVMNNELLPDDVIRLVRRFDVHGNGYCAVSRFLRMIVQCQAWKQTEKIVASQEEATEEAETIRKNIGMGIQNFGSSLLPMENDAAFEDFLSMAEYLGIRLLTERHLHWIVLEALSAPLPEYWIIQTGKTGDTFYVNTLTNKSQHAHPLDAYFFNLIDEYRANGNRQQIAVNQSGNLQSQPIGNSLPPRHNGNVNENVYNNQEPMLASTLPNPDSNQLNASNSRNNLLQQLLQGNIPQQQPAASESSLRKKFSTLQSGVQLQNQQHQQQQLQKTTKSFANVGYYDWYGRFHKAPKKLRPVSSISFKESLLFNGKSVVDRLVGISTLPHPTSDRNEESAQPVPVEQVLPRRAVSAGRVRPLTAGGGNNNSRVNHSADVAKRLEEMYSNNVIGKLDAVMKAPKDVIVQSDKAKITLEHNPSTGIFPSNLNSRSAKTGIVLLAGTK